MVLAAASVLLMPWATTYDPWAWIVWGREIAHGTLSTTTGPSWKPLPVLFTTPFSLAGEAAPALWLVVARAGGLIALAAAFAAARRIAGPLAGVTAALALALNLEFHRSVWLGNSEGLLIALLLLAVERELAGARRAAFAAGVAAALLRPEVWPFVFAQGCVLIWRDARMRVAVVAAGAGVLALWLVPELIGSGELLRAAERAQQPVASAATFAPNPALEVAKRAQAMLFGPVQALAVAAVAFALARRGSARARVTLALVGVAAAWLGLVALMTVEGFSGNSRYVLAPVAFVCVVAGVGAVATAEVIARLIRRAGAAATMAAALGTGLLAAGMVPSVVGQADELGARTAVLEYQAELRVDAQRAIERFGGRGAVLACGTLSTEDYSVPMLAWMLHVRLEDVELWPTARGVVFQARPGPHSPRDPVVRRSSRLGLRYREGAWRIFTGCRASPNVHARVTAWQQHGSNAG